MSSGSPTANRHINIKNSIKDQELMAVKPLCCTGWLLRCGRSALRFVALCCVAWQLRPPSSERSTMQLRQAAKKQMCHGRKGMNNPLFLLNVELIDYLLPVGFFHADVL